MRLPFDFFTYGIHSVPKEPLVIYYAQLSSQKALSQESEVYDPNILTEVVLGCGHTYWALERSVRKYRLQTATQLI